MSRAILADIGPLVALFDAGDQYHDWAVGCLGGVTEALVTSEAVLGEALFLLRDLPKSKTAFLAFWREGGVQLCPDAARDVEAIAALLRKYADTPMSMADATIVRLSELFSGAVVWTLDSDFRVYRRLGRRTIPLLHWPR